MFNTGNLSQYLSHCVEFLLTFITNLLQISFNILKYIVNFSKNKYLSFNKKEMERESKKNTEDDVPRNYSCWTSTSSALLEAAESKILSYLKTPFQGKYINIGDTVGKDDKIWTISLNTKSENVPLVMLHGLGAGVGFWVMNLDSLAENRPVYAMDVLGFGRSSRPKYSTDATIAEKQLVSSVEAWREKMNIDKMILLGHSMGGFIASSYAITHPERVQHLVLADPWGFPVPPTDLKAYNFLIRAIVKVLSPLNPLWAVRAFGPFGHWVMSRVRSDIPRKFETVLEEESHIISRYIHQCNAQKPSAEAAFQAMVNNFMWAKNPMLSRINRLPKEIPITILYGAESWLDNRPGQQIRRMRSESYVNVKYINGAGHHVYADQPDIFNNYVKNACEVRVSSDFKPDSYEKQETVHENTDSEELRKLKHFVQSIEKIDVKEL